MDNNRGAIAALIAVVLVVAAGLWLTQRLRADARIQDCVMAGRINCARIETPPRP